MERQDYLAAPNAINHPGTITLKDDIYALGGVLVQLFTGVLVEDVVANEMEELRNLLGSDRIPQGMRDVIEQMLDEDHDRRPHLKDVEAKLLLVGAA
jgi:hypothetical protein